MGRLPILILTIAVAGAGCRSEGPTPPAVVRNLVIITIDTLRADRVGAYGHRQARTPVMDRLAREGALFNRAFAVSPITLTSHASLLTGRYPPGHGARHNGMRMDPSVPTLAQTLASHGFATAAFVGAFPLDRRFGLDRGFATYSDRLPRGRDGRPSNERPAKAVADEAIAWLEQHRSTRFFLWVHFFEPHAPYGDAGDGRPIATRYDDEVAEADAHAGRVLNALGDTRKFTMVAITADHGEAFGEHGEIAHSIFVYDTTLRVPLILAGPGAPNRRIDEPVSHADLAPTLARMLNVSGLDADGMDLGEALAGRVLPQRELYAESFAPLLDFGWSPLRALRAPGWKYIEAPQAELYAISEDPQELRNRTADAPERAAALREGLKRYGSAELPTDSAYSESRLRLQALGYVGGGASTSRSRPDPKDRRELAARLAQVTSGELRGRELEGALRDIVRLDPGNPQAHLRLGYVLQASSRCKEAIKHFQRAIEAKVPGADPHLGLAGCLAAARRFDDAAAALGNADRAEPGNPVVAANLGSVLSDAGRPADGIPHLQRALSIDPALHEARFYLAIAFARAGRRDDARREASELLRLLPSDAPQRAEVQRLIAAIGH